MESKILQKNREELVEICRAMSPEDRLSAFLNHSELIHQIYQAGVEHRKTSSHTLLQERFLKDKTKL